MPDKIDEMLKELYAQTWSELQKSFNTAKKEKQYEKIIEIATKTLQLDAEAKFIGILVPSFEKDIADAYLKLEQRDKATEHYQAALIGYRAEHEKNKKTSPDSWQKEIERLEKKLKSLLPK